MVGLKDIARALLYKDTAQIYRNVAEKRGYLTNFNARPEMLFEMPCHLSSNTQNSLIARRNERTQQVDADLMLYYPPEYEVLEDDVIEVRGQKLIAGTAFKYPTHTELRLRRSREAAER